MKQLYECYIYHIAMCLQNVNSPCIKAMLLRIRTSSTRIARRELSFAFSDAIACRHNECTHCPPLPRNGLPVRCSAAGYHDSVLMTSILARGTAAKRFVVMASSSAASSPAADATACEGNAPASILVRMSRFQCHSREKE